MSLIRFLKFYLVHEMNYALSGFYRNCFTKSRHFLLHVPTTILRSLFLGLVWMLFWNKATAWWCLLWQIFNVFSLALHSLQKAKYSYINLNIETCSLIPKLFLTICSFVLLVIFYIWLIKNIQTTLPRLTMKCCP